MTEETKMSDPRFDYEYRRLRPESDGMGAAGGLMVLAVVVLLVGGLIYFAGDRPQTAERGPTQMVERSTQAPAPQPARPAQ
jgi:hypothetical protein